MDKYSVLKKYFGHSSFRDGQETLIDAVLSGNDALGIMPTGAGKSICYQVPALMMEGITIVISPLISLMQDQVCSLREYGIKAAYINSMLEPYEYSEVFRRAHSGEYKIIYVAPERLMTEEFFRLAEHVRISMVTVDEAHCISQWGQDFRPSYLKIADFIRSLSYRPVISAFTATATDAAKNDIISILGLNSPCMVTTGFDRPNLYFGVINTSQKYAELKKLLTERRDKSGVVYCLSRKNVENVCEKLNEDGFLATRYHAGLSAEERQANQEDFIYDRKKIMVATNAFGMGIDKSNVRFVIHYNMPQSLEHYYQEAGRAGRDGEPADCVILYSGMDVRTNTFLIEQSNEESELETHQQQEVREKELERLKYMTFYCTSTSCLRERLLAYFGEKHPGYCRNCSSCLSDYEEYDITVDAQKILSCVYRVHQTGWDYGKSVIMDILRGKTSDRLTKLRLDKVSTYGIMKDIPLKKLRYEIDHLIDNGYLLSVGASYPVLRLSGTSAAVLKGEKQLTMKLPKELHTTNKAQKEKEFFYDDPLFGQLRELRNELARKEKVPAYIIFSDAALKDMCRKLPVNSQEFMEVSGVGVRKAEKYGEIFCGIIAEYIKNEPDAEKAPEGEMDYMEKQLDSYREYVAVDQKRRK